MAPPHVMRFIPVAFFVTAFLSLQCKPLPGDTPKNEHGQSFDLSDYVPDRGPGVAVLVARNGKVLFENAAGYANVASRTPLKTDMVFNLASVSKQFTAMAVLMLEASGRLDASESIRKYIPELPAYAQNVRIMHLIHHQGGLPDYEEICEDTTPMTNQAVIEFLKTTRRPIFAPGTRYAYSNTGYALLAEIVARASKTPFDQFMQNQIFKPAGMRNSFLLTPDSMQRYNRLPVKGYNEDWKSGPFSFSGCDTLIGDGSVISNVQDLNAWIAALHKNKLLSKAQMVKYFTPRKAGGGPDYAYGLEKTEDDGEVTFSHDGSWGGFITNVSYYPDSHAWIIVLSNLDEFDFQQLNDDLYSAFLDQEP